jgi:23S rRNA (uridine2552-2'-O)-methyltransferase
VAILPKSWVNERKRDYYYRKAKEEKYRSRAAYKLFQIIKKYDFIKKNDIIVDLGAAPGSWTQVARKIVGDNGFVLSIDLKPIKPLQESNVKTIISDISDDKIIQHILFLLPRKANTVISDVSPNISGVWGLDHARQIDLATTSLKIALKILIIPGNFLVKVFQGDLLDNFIEKVKQHFKFVKLIKPKASRAKSAEMYILGRHIEITN